MIYTSKDDVASSTIMKCFLKASFTDTLSDINDRITNDPSII
jgi:hypothetical protein